MSTDKAPSVVVHNTDGVGPKTAIAVAFIGLVGSVAATLISGSRGESAGKQAVYQALAPNPTSGTASPDDIAKGLATLRSELDHLRKQPPSKDPTDSKAVEALAARLDTLERRVTDLAQTSRQPDSAMRDRLTALETAVVSLNDKVAQVAQLPKKSPPQPPPIEALLGTWVGQERGGTAVSIQVTRDAGGLVTGVITWPEYDQASWQFTVEHIPTVTDLGEKRLASFVGLKDNEHPDTYFGWKNVRRLQGNIEGIIAGSWYRVWIKGDTMTVALFPSAEETRPEWIYTAARQTK